MAVIERHLETVSNRNADAADAVCTIGRGLGLPRRQRRRLLPLLLPLLLLPRPQFATFGTARKVTA